MNSCRPFTLLAAMSVAALFSIPIAAQTIVTGEISGKVTDPTGAGIPKVEVTAKSESIGVTRTATTNDIGDFHLPLLPPGVYTISATASGFQPLSVRATVSLGQIANVGLKMSLQTVTDVVDVSTEACLLYTSEMVCGNEKENE